jgi:HK97 family phage major capsid protein
MSSDTLTIPRRTGGLTAYFVGEGQAITPSDKTWDNVNLVAKKLACLSYWSSELAEDAIISIGDDLAGEIAYAFSLKEDECYFNGDGTSTFGGIVGIRTKLRNVDATIGNIKGLEVASGTGYATNYNSVTLADFHDVLGRLPLYARAGAAWVMSTTFFDSVAHRLQTAAGGNTMLDIANGGVPRFLGYPVIYSQVMPVTSAVNQIAALLGNFRLGTAMGDRRALTLALSTEYKFAEDQLAIRGTDRFDINVHDVGNTTAAGPIVGLITASS